MISVLCKELECICISGKAQFQEVGGYATQDQKHI